MTESVVCGGRSIKPFTNNDTDGLFLSFIDVPIKTVLTVNYVLDIKYEWHDRAIRKLILRCAIDRRS